MINDVFLNRVIDLKSKIDKEKSFNSGMEVGAKNQKIEILITMYNKGYNLEEISSVVNMTVLDVENITNEYKLRQKSGVNVIPVNV